MYCCTYNRTYNQICIVMYCIVELCCLLFNRLGEKEKFELSHVSKKIRFVPPPALASLTLCKRRKRHFWPELPGATAMKGRNTRWVCEGASRSCAAARKQSARGEPAAKDVLCGGEDYWELRNQRCSSWWDAREGGVIKALGKRRDKLWQRRSRWKHQHGAKDALKRRSLAPRHAQRSHFWTCVAADWLLFHTYLIFYKLCSWNCCTSNRFSSKCLTQYEAEERRWSEESFMAAVIIQVLQQKWLDLRIPVITQNSMFNDCDQMLSVHF